MLDSLTINELTGKFIVGILFFIRVLALMASGPFFDNTTLLPRVKVYLSILIALMMTSAFWRDQPPIDFHLLNLVLLVLKEVIVGLIIGFSASIVFAAARFAGGLIDFDMGYQTSLMFNIESTPTLVGELKSLVVLIIFLVIDGHHYLIEGIFASAKAVPIGSMVISESTIKLLVRLTTSVLIIGVKMAAPVMVALFLTNLSLSLLARVAPQTNVFILSFQLKVGIGLLILMAAVPIFIMITKYALLTMEDEITKVLLSLYPGNV